jgi:hypothetical protein
LKPQAKAMSLIQAFTMSEQVGGLAQAQLGQAGGEAGAGFKQQGGVIAACLSTGYALGKAEPNKGGHRESHLLPQRDCVQNAPVFS